MVAVVSVVGGVIIAIGGYLLKYLVRSSGTLGRIETKLIEFDRDIKAIKQWQLDHTAEHVADRNAYWDRSSPRRR